MTKNIPLPRDTQALSIADRFKQSIVSAAQVNLINFDYDEITRCIFVLFSDGSQIHFAVEKRDVAVTTLPDSN